MSVSDWLIHQWSVPLYAPDPNRLTYNRHPGLAFWPIMEDLPGRVCGKWAVSTDSSLCTYRATTSVRQNRLVLEYALNPLSHLLKRKKVYWRAINKTNHGLYVYLLWKLQTEKVCKKMIFCLLWKQLESKKGFFKSRFFQNIGKPRYLVKIENLLLSLKWSLLHFYP